MNHPLNNYPTELDELTDGKTIRELQLELDFQLNIAGEHENSNICSHIKDAIAAERYHVQNRGTL